MKSATALPVMLCGRLLRNQVYTGLNYAEGLIITLVIGFFVWDFQLHEGRLYGRAAVPADAKHLQDLLAGGMFMLCYVCVDALSSNLEDYVFQSARVDPARQMLGTEALSAVLAWLLAPACGQAGRAAGEKGERLLEAAGVGGVCRPRLLMENILPVTN